MGPLKNNGGDERNGIRSIAETGDDPLRLLGMHYVLEGSNNGSRFIARHVGRAYQLSTGPGLRYLDPYGDRQRAYWMDFKNAMGKFQFTGADEERGRRMRTERTKKNARKIIKET